MGRKPKRVGVAAGPELLGAHNLTAIYDRDIDIVNYVEVTEGLMRALEENKPYIDEALYTVFSASPELVTEILSSELSTRVIFNTMNTSFGRGLLLGMISETLRARHNAEIEERDGLGDENEEEKEA